MPDSVDGRFELIALHVILIMTRLEGEKGARTVNQALFDVMFRDMATSLREMGIGDLAVPKHMKRMMNGFNGRLRNYAGALNGEGDLADAVRRNIYGTVEKPDENMVIVVKDYIENAAAHLKALSRDDVLKGLNLYPAL